MIWCRYNAVGVAEHFGRVRPLRTVRQDTTAASRGGVELLAGAPYTMIRSSVHILAVIDAFPATLLKLLRVLSPHLCSLNVCRTLIVRTTEHAYDAKQYRLRCLHGRPALRRRFIAIFVFFGRMQDGNADLAAFVDYEQLRVSSVLISACC